MRSETLVFLHALAAATLVGGLLAVAALAAGGAAGRIIARAAAIALASALATVSVGEATRAREGAAGTWLDVGTLLGYAGLLIPSVALVVLARRAGHGRRRQRQIAGLASAMLGVALTAAFVMAAKPF